MTHKVVFSPEAQQQLSDLLDYIAYRASPAIAVAYTDSIVSYCESLSTFPHRGKGVLRGLHYQIQQPQGKLVRVTQGAVFDVAVDLRRSSHNFGKWVGVELSADNKRQLWVPPGFAHGFVVTSESAEFLYKTTDYYAPEHERCVRWNDPAIGIQWPLTHDPQLSAKDAAGQLLAEAECY